MKPLPQPIYKHGEISSEDLPEPVREAVRRWEERNGVWPHSALKALRWDSMNGCYAFTWAGVFYGVETDGHIHT